MGPSSARSSGLTWLRRSSTGSTHAFVIERTLVLGHTALPNSLPVLAMPRMVWTRPHFEAVRTCSIAGATATTAGPAVVNLEADSAQGAGGFDDVADGRFRLSA
jgi:hypothetical protein